MTLTNEDLLKDKAYINGKWVAGNSSFSVKNPADGSVIGKVPDLAGEETKRAIEAAENALPSWSALSAKERGKILSRWSSLMMEHQDALSMLMTLEQGKPVAESKSEIAYAASFFDWYAAEGQRAYGDVVPSPIDGARILITKQPIGVCGVITPWNFPSAMITRKVGAALGAGCTVVCKPAENTPLSALALAVLGEAAGVPAGVFNVLTGKDPVPISGEMCANKAVKKISFTGSTAVGKILMRQCSKTLKKLSLELGGNAPFIVFEDADIDAAVEGAMVCKYRNAGQTCVCANRIYVHESIHDVFVKKLTKKVEALHVGDGMQGAKIGPLISEDAVEKVKDHIADALKHGAKLVSGGESHSKGGQFFKPTILTGMTKDMVVAQEETFGPVAPIFKFSDESEVLSQANDTVYGLAAYFYTKDMARTWRVSEALEYGMVAVNTGILSTEVAPFGGVKESGFGREGSRYGLDDYMQMKYTLMAGLES